MIAQEPRRVLIATQSVSGPSGTDLYTRDLALALLRAGWLPIVYTSVLGPLAADLRRVTIPVTDDISSIAVMPDVIHGHHALETLTALACFDGVPALFVCHDSISWHSIPPRCSRIGEFVAVDRNCRDRMTFEHGIPGESIRILGNAVDLERFRRRGPLPPAPRRAALFSNAAARNTFAGPIEAACARRGITLDIIGMSSGRPVSNPEELLPQYDVVFAKARCALEAATVGAAVVLCDVQGVGGMVTSGSLDEMRALNFGIRTLQGAITTERIGQELDRYDAADAAIVSDRLRAAAGVDVLAQRYIELYEELCNRPVASSTASDLAEIGRALSHVTRTMHRPAVRAVPWFPLRRILLNSKALSWPVRWLYLLKRRLHI